MTSKIAYKGRRPKMRCERLMHAIVPAARTLAAGPGRMGLQGSSHTGILMCEDLPMRTIRGISNRPAGPLSRRSFIAGSAFAAGALTLADLLRAEEAAGIRSSHKAV